MRTHFVHISAALPYLLAPLENVDTFEDENVTFRCITTGLPQPTVTWYSNGRLLEGLFDCLIHAHY